MRRIPAGRFPSRQGERNDLESRSAVMDVYL
jgi:hypothetical protein